MSRYIAHLLKEFSKANRDLCFETLVHESAKAEYLSDPTHVHSIHVTELVRNPLLNIAWHQLVLPGLCKKRDFDVLFLPAANRRVPLSVPCPTVGTVHDFTSLHIEGKYDPRRMFYQAHVLPYLVRNLTHVIAISESTKKDILEHVKLSEDRITVIPSAADTEIFYPRDRKTAGERMRVYGVRSPYILYLSRIEHPGKNHLRLIHAFERVKRSEQVPHQLVLAGSDWHGAEVVHRAARESVYAADILIAGFVGAVDLPDLYNGAEFLGFPSLFEGFGLPILEAMACGVPVACSNVSSMPEVAGNAAVYFNPKEEEDMAEALKTLLLSDQLRAEYGRKGLERSKGFSWSSTAQKTLDVIKAAAGGKSFT